MNETYNFADRDLVISSQRDHMLLLAESDDAGNNGLRLWSAINVITEENQGVSRCDTCGFNYGLKRVVAPMDVPDGQGSHGKYLQRPAAKRPNSGPWFDRNTVDNTTLHIKPGASELLIALIAEPPPADWDSRHILQ